MTAIYKREVKSYFNNVLGYIFCAFILLFIGIYTMAINLTGGSANFEYSIGNMAFIYMIAVPILTMRVIAEERKQKTDQLLYSLPMSMSEVVMGKFFALLTVLLVPTVISCIYPLILTAYGKINFFASYGTILAFFLLGSSLLSMGLFISSMTDNQITAVISTFVVVLINYYIVTLADYVSYSTTATFVAFTVLILLAALCIYFVTKNSVIAVLAAAAAEVALLVYKLINPDALYGVFPKLMGKISVFERFYNFPNGMFDLTSVAYFIIVTAVFLFLTVQSMEKRRWS